MPNKNIQHNRESELTVKAPLKFSFSLEGIVTLTPMGKMSFAIKNESMQLEPYRQPASVQNEVPNVPSKMAYSIKEIIQLFPVSRATLYREINEGRLKMHKIGLRRTVIMRDELMRWAQAKTPKR